MPLICVLLAVLSVWDYPARQATHERLVAQFAVASHGAAEKDVETMRETCRKGTELLPDDPTWRYNLACSLACADEREAALDELEKAIDLGFRNADAIAGDADFRPLAESPRFKELVAYAREMSRKPLLAGPLVNVSATGMFGESISLGEQNLLWDLETGCFRANLKLEGGAGDHVGELYMNRDGRHSLLSVTNFPGLTAVTFDREGRSRHLDLDVPNVIFPYPTFGNSSRAMTTGPYWRSIPRALLTTDLGRLKTLQRMYLANQFWVFPSNADTPPVGTNGDVFASVAPYWLVTAGRSWSDKPYLAAALKASAAFAPETKAEIVRRGLLVPTIQSLLRKSLAGVTNETAYLGPRAHPTAFPANGLDLDRLVRLAAALTPDRIPPLAVISVTTPPLAEKPVWPELTYATGFAWAFVLRAEEKVRTFYIRGKGAAEYAFAVVHGDPSAVKIERLGDDAARVTVERAKLDPTHRVDIGVFGRNPGTEWGNPSFVSFAATDPSAPYSDPALTPLPQPAFE